MMNGMEAVEARGFKAVGYCDLQERAGFKIAAQEVAGSYYLYLSSFWHSGWSVVDVTDPSAPELVGFVEGPGYDRAWTTQVQVADGLMIGSLEQPFPGLAPEVPDDFDEGVWLFDVAKDPTKPQLLSEYRVGGTGTHRNFYAGGRYAYLAAAVDGYEGHCLVVLDVEDPAHPREAGRWWWPGQHVAGGEKPEFQTGPNHGYMHGPAYVVGDRAFVSYGNVGAVILDVSVPTQPRLLSRVSTGDLGQALGCHTVVPLPERNLMIMNSEAIKEGYDEGANYAFVVDISDVESPRIISSLPTPRPASGAPYRSYHEKGGRFGPHNQAHRQGQGVFKPLSNYVLLTYFNAGLRLFDIHDPYQPEEVGYFVPADPDKRWGFLPRTKLVASTEDVAIDNRGFIYITDKNAGLRVLECERELD